MMMFNAGDFMMLILWRWV